VAPSSTSSARTDVAAMLSFRRAYRAEPRACSIKRRSRSGSSGISRTRTPSGASASSIASATSAGTGIAPASPTPLIPSAFSGDGVSMWPISISGI